MTLGLINVNPIVHAKKERVVRADHQDYDDDAVDPLEIYDILLVLYSLYPLVRLLFDLLSSQHPLGLISS
ncbi:hypothetical protein MKX03_012761, partial [Papaver bracteatum]